MKKQLIALAMGALAILYTTGCAGIRTIGDEKFNADQEKRMIEYNRTHITTQEKIEHPYAPSLLEISW